MSEQNIHPEDQVSLSGLKNIIKEFVVLFFRAISFIGDVIRKWTFLLLAGLICGLALGYVYHAFQPKFYKVSMVVMFNELNKKFYAEILDQLNKLTTSGSTQKLAAALQVSDQVAGSVLSIDSRNMNDEPLRNDTSSKVRQLFKIIVRLNDNKSSDNLQNGILNYLNNGPFLKHVKDEQRKSYLAKISFINEELAKLDSLKNEYTRFIASSKISATFYNNAFNPTEIYIHSNNLVNQRESLLNLVSIEGTAVSLVDGFKITSSPQSSSLLRYLLITGGLGLVAGLILGFYIEARKRLIRS
jgi:uncharacterized protein involved in exopolysaccharide biosynthesis